MPHRRDQRKIRRAQVNEVVPVAGPVQRLCDTINNVKRHREAWREQKQSETHRYRDKKNRPDRYRLVRAATAATSSNDNNLNTELAEQQGHRENPYGPSPRPRLTTPCDGHRRVHELNVLHPPTALLQCLCYSPLQGLPCLRLGLRYIQTPKTESGGYGQQSSGFHQESPDIINTQNSP